MSLAIAKTSILTKSILTVSILATSILANPIQATAKDLTLKVFPANTARSGICPSDITLTEKGRPYTEGSYTVDGEAKLDWLAGAFKIVATDRFSVTWQAKLQNKYQNCIATAGFDYDAEERTQRHSYLRMQFDKGKVYLILDMTGRYDANRLTPTILYQAVKDGNPIWSWSGSD
jgi:hypothetical protein